MIHDPLIDRCDVHPELYAELNLAVPPQPVVGEGELGLIRAFGVRLVPRPDLPRDVIIMFYRGVPVQIIRLAGRGDRPGRRAKWGKRRARLRRLWEEKAQRRAAAREERRRIITPYLEGLWVRAI